MIGLLGRLGAAATLGRHCPQMTQRPGMRPLSSSGAAILQVQSVQDLPLLFQTSKRSHWDALLALKKPTDTLKLERGEIIEQVISGGPSASGKI